MPLHRKHQPSRPPTAKPGCTGQGANSFTEDQAKSRIEEAGYKDVTGLKLREDGVWEASAMKGTEKLDVQLDYRATSPRRRCNPIPHTSSFMNKGEEYANCNWTFDSYSAAQDAVARLESAGFPSDDISIVSHHDEKKAMLAPEQVLAQGLVQPSAVLAGSSPASASWPFPASVPWWLPVGSQPL